MRNDLDRDDLADFVDIYIYIYIIISTIMDDYVTSLVNTAVKVIGGFKCMIIKGVNMGANIKEAIDKSIAVFNACKAEGFIGPQTAEQVIPVVNFIFVNKICLNSLILTLRTSVIKTLIFDVDKYKVHIEICVKIISIIFDPEDITEMMGYLETYKIDQITPTIATKIDKLLEAAEQIIELITTNSDDPVAIALPPCLSDKIKSTSCGNDIQESIKTCSKSLQEESNRKNPINREALFKIINEYKPDPSLSEDKNNQKRMKLILVIAFILNLYAKTSVEGIGTWNDVGEDGDEDGDEDYSQFPGGNRNKSRRVKSRRNKSRRVKSRRVKSRRVKSRRVKSRRVKSRRNRK